MRLAILAHRHDRIMCINMLNQVSKQASGDKRKIAGEDERHTVGE